MRLRERWHAVRASDEAGLGLVELMFAFVVFSIIALGVAYGLQSASATTRQNRNRVQAANLASRELEISRQEFQNKDIDGPGLIGDAGTVTNPHPLPGQTAGDPLTIDGLAYTVVREVQWLPAGVGQSPCDGGSAVTYPVLAVSVTVTWPQMGTTQPIRSNTILSPSKEHVSGGDAYLAIKVVGASGGAQAGIPVTVTNGSTTTMTTSTSADGCAVFEVPGTNAATGYTVTVAKSGYVSNTFTTTGTGSLSVTAGGLARTSIAYDKAATLVVQLKSRSGYTLPTELLPVTLYSTDIVGGVKPYPGAGAGGGGSASTTITGLWPSTTGYVSWPGACTQSDPNNAGSTRSTAVAISPGGTGTASHTLPAVTLNLQNSLSQPVGGRTVEAYPVNAGGCGTENPITLGVTDSGGQLRTSVPAGVWEFRAQGLTPNGAWPQLTFKTTSFPQTATLKVTP
jgi:type II secretory pathway pseudopilin PulG